MPMYTYSCECGNTEEVITSVSERDMEVVTCDVCASRMTRTFDMPVIGKSRHQTCAIMDDGRTVPGHFGKMARKK